MKMKKRFLSILLSLVMVLGLMPGMGLTAYADAHLAITVNPTGGGSVTQVQKNSTEFTCTAIPNSGFTFLKWTYVDSNWANRESTNNPQVFSDSCRSIKAFFVQVVNVSDVVLDPPAAQTIEVDGKVSFTATVTPDSATDKTVKWSVGGTDTGAVKLYTDADCTTEVGANATDKLTVYAKGISTGSATVTATSNADSTKTASCAVTVVPTPYPLWVGGVQVTSANASNITGGDPVTASYNAETKTLTLNGYNNNGQGKIDDDDMVTVGLGIYAEGIDLTIHLTGVNTVTGPSSEVSYGIYLSGEGKQLTIEGEGTLTAAGASGADSYGIVPGYNGAVIINAELTATGTEKALLRNVKNSIPGTGWNNVEGTGDGTAIAVSETGQTLSYKKVQFVDHTHAFTYTDNDGDTITATCANTDEKCTLDDGSGNQTATLTIAAPTSGNDATVTVSPAGAITGYEVKYQTKNGSTWGEETTTAPTGAGIHRASIALTGTDSKTAKATVSYGNNCITYAANLEHGSISGDAGATCGATITPTITPDEGYELDALTVTPEAGSGISATDITVDGDTFVMPEANVTVSATFKKINRAITLTQPAAGGTITAKIGDNAVTTADCGDTITLGNTPADGYEISSYSVTKTGDSSTTVTVTEGSFTMPAYPVTVTGSFTPIDYTVTVNSAANGSVTAKKGASEVTTANIGDEITLTYNPDAGYQLDTLTVTKEGGGTVTVSNDKFTMPASNVTVSATFKEITYTVEADDAKATVTDSLPTPNTWTAELNIPADKTYDGETVDLTTATVQKSANFPDNKVTVGAVSFKDQNNNTVTAAKNVGTYTASATVGDKTISKAFTIQGRSPITYVESTERVGNNIVISLTTTDQYLTLEDNPNGITLLMDGETYVASGNIKIGALVFVGDVKLILCKNTTVTIYAGIYHIGSTLNIYTEEGAEGSGLIVEGNTALSDLTNDTG